MHVQISGSRFRLSALTGGVVVMALPLLLGGVTLSGLSASFASLVSGRYGSYGSDPGFCQPADPSTAISPTVTATSGTGSPGAVPTPGGGRNATITARAVGTTAPICAPASQIGTQVVAWARAMADALYVNPACGGQISEPGCYDTWFKTPTSLYPPGAPNFPQAVIEYGARVCPGCYAWANGTYQCVSFVRGAYAQVYPMRITANVFDLWATYAGQPGWQEIPAAAGAAAPPAARGLPLPGDVTIFKDASLGHAAIVMSVLLPSATAEGVITFSNATSASPYSSMPLLPDLSDDTSAWPGSTVWGYLRPALSAQPATTPGPITG